MLEMKSTPEPCTNDQLYQEEPITLSTAVASKSLADYWDADPPDSVFRQKVKNMQAKELVSKIIDGGARDRINRKKSRMESFLGIKSE